MIGGGTRSPYWGQLIANVLNLPLCYRRDATVGSALGAARLARLGTEGVAVNEVCTEAPIEHVIDPDSAKVAYYQERYSVFQKLYRYLNPQFKAIHQLSI